LRLYVKRSCLEIFNCSIIKKTIIIFKYIFF
jgi:hypothetical protein